MDVLGWWGGRTGMLGLVNLVQTKNTVSGDSERKDGFLGFECGGCDVVGPRGNAGQLLHHIVRPAATGREVRGR